MTREEILKSEATFTWLWDERFFVESIRYGNFIYSDPLYPRGNKDLV